MSTGKVTKAQIRDSVVAALGLGVHVTDFPGNSDWKPGVELNDGKHRIVIHSRSRQAARRFTLDLLQHLLSPKNRRVARQAAELALETERAKATPDQIDIAEYEALLQVLK